MADIRIDKFALTKAQHDEICATRTRALTDLHPGLRRERFNPETRQGLIDGYLQLVEVTE